MAGGSHENGSPRVSVLLPVLNAEETIETCLRSIARQVELDWECILVDDGSRDASLTRAARFAERDARVRLFPAPHRGLVAALGSGLAKCRGKYVARMDADDVMHRRRLADQADLLDANPAWAGAGCHVRAFPRSALGPGDRAYEKWINGIRSAEDVEREAFVECPLVHPTWIFRREVLLEHGYQERPWPEDYDLILRLITGGASVGVLPRRRLCWRHGADRLSRRSPLYEPRRFTECKATYLARSFLARSERYILWGYGATGRALCRALMQRGKRPSHIVELHAGRLGNLIHGAPVIPSQSLREVPRLPLIVSVAREGPRNEIRHALGSMGFVETLDFVCAA